jgi:hypothetical protein
VIVVALFASAAGADAQTHSPSLVPAPHTPASVHGVVTSTDGAVYQGANVKLQFDGAVSAPLFQQTDSDGAFNFTNLDAGAFKLTVSSGGFVTQEVAGVLSPGQVFNTNTIVLPVSSSSTEVRVSAGSQADIAQAQLDIEEKQRVLGMFPNYYVSYDHNAVPLTSRQKYQLAWKTVIDPVTWAMTGVVAGAEQADNTFAGYGQGMQGYSKRFAANYADGFFGTVLGGAVLPSLFKQDPRYFYKGTGSVPSRAGYSIANAVICKSDKGRWQPNYSGILGGIAAGGISNLYYPSSDRSGVDVTFENALIGTAEGAIQNLFQEFIVRRLTPRLPVYPSTATQ